MAHTSPKTITFHVNSDARGAWSTILGQAKDLMACVHADDYHRWLVGHLHLGDDQYDPPVQRQPLNIGQPVAPRPSYQARFRLFPRLPAEIRHKIFLLSVPAIIIEGRRLYPYDEPVGSYRGPLGGGIDFQMKYADQKEERVWM